MRDGQALSLAVQLDLADVRHGEIPGLPQEGWLWLFVQTDERDNPFFPEHVVLFADPHVELRTPTAPDGSDRPFTPRSPIWEPGFALVRPDVEEWPPEIDDPRVDPLEDETTTIGGAGPSWCESGVMEAALTSVGLGAIIYHYRVDDEGLAEEIDRHRNAIPDWAHVYADHLENVVKPGVLEFRRRRAEIERRAAGYRTLVLLASEPDVGWSWVDAGYLEVLIHEDDLRTRRFDRTYLRVCST